MLRTLLLVALSSALVGCNKGPSKTPLSSVSAGIATSSARESTTGKRLEMGMELQPRATFKPKHRLSKGLQHLMLTPDGTRLVIPFADDKKTEIWDIVGEPKQVKEINGEAFAISPDGALVVRSINHEYDIANTETGAAVYKVPSSLRSRRFAFRSPTVIWHVQVGEKRERWLVRDLNTATGQESVISEIADDPSSDRGLLDVDGRTELIRGFEKTRRVQSWDIASGKITRDVTLSVKDVPESWSQFDVSLDGKWISAEFRVDQGVHIFDGKSGSLVSILPKQVYDGRFVPKHDLFVGKWIRGEMLDGRWQVAEGHGFFDTHTGKIRAFAPSDGLLRAISANGNVMVTAQKSGDLKVWDLSPIPSP